MLGRQGPVASSGFSDAQHVFSPKLIHIFDSTVWKVVTRMQWTDWRHQHCQQQAVRLHIKLRLADLQPSGIEISEGEICERAAMCRLLKPGEFYLGDRNC